LIIILHISDLDLLNLLKTKAAQVFFATQAADNRFPHAPYG
jgi:hypothetical protein